MTARRPNQETMVEETMTAAAAGAMVIPADTMTVVLGGILAIIILAVHLLTPLASLPGAIHHPRIKSQVRLQIKGWELYVGLGRKSADVYRLIHFR